MNALIVVIDSSPTVRTVLEVCLHRAGYEDVYTFADGGQFLRWLQTPQARIPSLLIVDLNLPVIDGCSLIRTLRGRAAFAGTSFVVLSGRDGVVDRLKARLCGARVYLTKPFCTQDIVAVVESLLESASLSFSSLAPVLYESQERV